MVSMAMDNIPKGVLYNVICETPSCLPDSVQLLTPCTTGNGRLKIINLGRYAVCLYDKENGNGIRVFIDTEKLEPWDEIKTWLLKLKIKKEQDSEKLLAQVYEAGNSIYSCYRVQIQPKYLGRQSKGDIAICGLCGEAYPVSNGKICLGCQGEAPYVANVSSV
jgi:formylmethanofuran dehydrogenase subunit E